jgi:enterochelin esterase family protein
MIHESQIYPNTKTDWWIYVPAQYDASKPAALMVWQDGEGLTKRDGSRVQIMIDNLTHEKKIPVIVHVFIAPASRQMRSIEYDRMDDTYARFLRDEIVPKVAKMYNIRTDGYSRAISGASSGGIAAFNVAWHMPDQFSRVLSLVGSFTSIQWRAGERDGGNLYPFLIRKSPKRNIRVWLQDGSNDLENNHGSWPLQNLQMANSLKMQGYDFRLRWTTSFHGGGGGPDRAEGLIWLWRCYDPAKTSEEYAQDPAEKDKPMFRVRALNRVD